MSSNKEPILSLYTRYAIGDFQSTYSQHSIFRAFNPLWTVLSIRVHSRLHSYICSNHSDIFFIKH